MSTSYVRNKRSGSGTRPSAKPALPVKQRHRLPRRAKERTMLKKHEMEQTCQNVMLLQEGMTVKQVRGL